MPTAPQRNNHKPLEIVKRNEFAAVLGIEVDDITEPAATLVLTNPSTKFTRK